MLYCFACKVPPRSHRYRSGPPSSDSARCAPLCAAQQTKKRRWDLGDQVEMIQTYARVHSLTLAPVHAHAYAHAHARAPGREVSMV